MKVKIFHSADAQKLAARVRRALAIYQCAVGVAKVVRYGLAGDGRRILRNRFEVLLPADVLHGIVLDGEVGGEHAVCDYMVNNEIEESLQLLHHIGYQS